MLLLDQRHCPWRLRTVTAEVVAPRAVLQNTLEQMVLAVLVHVALAVPLALSVPPIGASRGALRDKALPSRAWLREKVQRRALSGLR